MEYPLEGVKLLDFTRVTAGPYASLLLADMGVEVIKIEPPTSTFRKPRGMLTTSSGKKYDFAIKGISTHFLSLNRNKKSLVLNMRKAEGKEIFYDLVKKADVVFDNFRAGTPRKMGIDFDTISKINPRIISFSITAYGESGPLSDKGGYDSICQAMGGGMSITTAPDGSPIRPGIPMADVGAGLLSTIGILTALRARDRTGKGMKADTSILGGQLSFLTYMVSDYFSSGESCGPSGVGKRLDPCRHWYKCKDGRYILTAPRHTSPSSGGWFEDYARAIGQKELAVDPRFQEDDKRLLNRDQLAEILEEAFLAKTVEEWERVFAEADIPCGPVNSIAEACTQPQATHEKMVESYPHPLGGEFKAAVNPIKMRGFKNRRNAPPVRGEHTVEILSGFLGYSDKKLAGLKEKGIIDYP